MKKLYAAILRWLNPDYSYCARCKMPWKFVEPKTIRTSETSGTFATCKECWDKSTLPELIHYYTVLYYHQEEQIEEYNHRWNRNLSMDHTLDHLLSCVVKEYNKTHKS